MAKAAPTSENGARVVAVRKSQGPPPQDWQRQRSNIERLYREEKRPLKEVVEIMRKDFNFHATERMYKTRIRAWGFDRKRKAPEMRFAYYITETRRKQGKATAIRIRDEIVTEHDVHHYFKRHPRPTTVEMLQDMPTPPELDYDSPRSMTPIALTSTYHADVADDDEEQDVEEVGWDVPLNVIECNKIPSFGALQAFGDDSLTCSPLRNSGSNQSTLRNLHNYFGGLFFDSDHWKPWANLPLSRAHRRRGYQSSSLVDDPYETYDEPGQLVGSVEVAIRLFEARRAMEAGRLLDIAFSTLKQLLVQQHPQFVTSILLLIQLLHKKDLPELLSMLLEQLYNMSAIVLKPSHPLTTTISALAQAREDILEPAFEYILSIYNTRAGQLHAQHLESTYIYAWSQLQRGRRDKAWESLSRLLEIYSDHIESTDMRLRQVLYSLAQIAISDGDIVGADRILQDVQHRIEERFGADAVVEMKVECLRLRGVLRREFSQGGEDRSMLLDAAYLGSQILSNDHPVMLLLQQDLQD